MTGALRAADGAAGHGRGFGRGKLILAGEHAVVYGHPAIAFAVDRGVRVTVAPTEGPTRVEPADARLSEALRVVLPDRGFTVALHSDLPIGRGMGSSAAIAVGLVRAAAEALGERLGAEAEWERAFAIERVFHGTPSGIDQAVSARGGALLYRKGPPIAIQALPCPSWRVVVLDSGSCGETRALVQGVRDRRPAVDPALDAIGALVPRVQAALHDPAALGPLLTENHRLLREIGVSTPALDELVALALRAGARGAKLAGAGGGGVVLALVDDPAPLLAAARAAGVPAFVTGPCPADPGEGDPP
jgi:mevalonate kinase